MTTERLQALTSDVLHPILLAELRNLEGGRKMSVDFFETQSFHLYCKLCKPGREIHRFSVCKDKAQCQYNCKFLLYF